MYRLAVISLMILLLSACAGKGIELNRSVFESNKIALVRVDQLQSTVRAEKSTTREKIGIFGGVTGVVVGTVIDKSTDAARARSLTPLAKALSDYNINQHVSDALANHLRGGAFAERVTFDTIINPKDKTKPYLVPRVTPSVVMAADYSSIIVTFEVVTYQNREGKKPHRGVYSAEHVLDSHGEKVTKSDNFQFWLDNADILKEHISLKIDEAAAEFAKDFNSLELTRTYVDPSLIAGQVKPKSAR